MESDYAKDFINSSTINETINKITPLLKNLFSESLDLIMGVFSAFIILIYLIFILLGYPKLNESWEKWIPIKYRDSALEIISDLNNGMRATLEVKHLSLLLWVYYFALDSKLLDYL